ncbi:hypothetical protein [Streptomyces sp. NPDC002265]|uniref:hypothetical protein n=1 Tax=Streptomyces sp. NPDC002265 TaxID=3154415 RepID=UPI0033296376
MGTDIYGGIEFRHTYAGTDDYDGEPWVTAMDLWPLYDETDYKAFGLLFGVRNYAGFPPLAAARGLPADLSSGMRSHLGSWIERGEMDGASWVSWGELASLDPATEPEHFVGEPPTAGSVLGAKTHWPHVFAVMKALAGRFGDDGVRLVVAFD